ncbi:MAG: acetamidase/formamidase family protein, partial [Gaiellaceae bacterium]
MRSDSAFVVELDLDRPLVDDPRFGHNRWHPAIAPVATIEQDEIVRADLRDGLDCQIVRDSTLRDVNAMDMTRGHPLTGPFFVIGAAPGDLLEVEILEVAHRGFGFTCVRRGAGMLQRFEPEPFLARWLLDGVGATSPEIPGVRIPAAPFVGVVGVAPSEDNLARYREREEALRQSGGDVPLPYPKTAVPSSEPVASAGLRTIPPRENGGNLDARYLGPGAIVKIPVQVTGALLSLGDAHYAQGHGEICSQAIEMAASVSFTCRVRKGEELGWRPEGPVLLARPARPTVGQRLVTTGLPVRSGSPQREMDLNEAAVAALLEMERYLVLERGLSRSQAHVIMSVAVDLEVLEAVNKPNVLVGASIDTGIFD